jgi:hypothetical protein
MKKNTKVSSIEKQSEVRLFHRLQIKGVWVGWIEYFILQIFQDSQQSQQNPVRYRKCTLINAKYQKSVKFIDLRKRVLTFAKDIAWEVPKCRMSSCKSKAKKTGFYLRVILRKLKQAEFKFHILHHVLQMYSPNNDSVPKTLSIRKLCSENLSVRGAKNWDIILHKQSKDSWSME